MASFAPVRDKSNIGYRLDSLPPMSLVTTDWRDVDMGAADFGFSRAAAVRQLADKVPETLIVFYPLRTSCVDPDHGLEVVVPFEKYAVEMLINDPDMKQFCIFRGFEAGAPVGSSI